MQPVDRIPKDKIPEVFYDFCEIMKPSYEEFNANYAKPLKLPLEKMRSFINEKIKDPSFYAYSILAISAWNYKVTFIVSAIIGLSLTGLWNLKKEEVDKNSLLNSKWTFIESGKGGLFNSCVEWISRNHNTDQKICIAASLLFFGWYSSYSAIFLGIMVGNELWLKSNDQRAEYIEKQLCSIDQSSEFKDKAELCFNLSYFLKQGEKARGFTKKDLLVKAIESENKSKKLSIYYVHLLEEMSSRDSVQIGEVKYSKEQLIKKLQELINSDN